MRTFLRRHLAAAAALAAGAGAGVAAAAPAEAEQVFHVSDFKCADGYQHLDYSVYWGTEVGNRVNVYRVEFNRFYRTVDGVTTALKLNWPTGVSARLPNNAGPYRDGWVPENYNSSAAYWAWPGQYVIATTASPVVVTATAFQTSGSRSAVCTSTFPR